MTKAKMEKLKAMIHERNKETFWLEIEMTETDSIIREACGDRLRTMMYPQGSQGRGMGMEFKFESHFLRKKTEKGAVKKGWPVGFVKLSRNDMSLFRHYLAIYKGSGRAYATSIGLAGVL